jgi:hypothetical protein
MRKTTSRIAKLPLAIRTEINRKLRDSWPYNEIAAWLFAQTASEDIPTLDLRTGDSYSLIWIRTTETFDHARHACEQALSNWYCTRYPIWVEEEAHRDESIRLVERVEQLGNSAAEKGLPNSNAGVNTLIRSQIIEAIDRVRTGSKNPDQLARLAHAWARMNESSIQTERFKLATEESTRIAIAALASEVRGHPETLAAFNAFYATVKRVEAARTKVPPPTHPESESSPALHS